MKFLEWFIRTTTQKRWAELGGYTASAKVLKSEEFRNATPYNEAFYQSMFMVKDFWAVPEYAELLTQINDRIYPYVVDGEGTAKEALDGLAQDWQETFKKSTAADGRLTDGAGRAPPGQQETSDRERRRPRAGKTRHPVPGGGPGLERSRDPESLHHSDDRVPDHLQRLPADLLARLLLHRLPRLGERAGRASSACRTTASS